MSPHVATDLRASAWRGTAGSVAEGEDLEKGPEPGAETGTSFRRACLIIVAWLLALLLIPILFLQPL